MRVFPTSVAAAAFAVPALFGLLFWAGLLPPPLPIPLLVAAETTADGTQIFIRATPDDAYRIELFARLAGQSRWRRYFVDNDDAYWVGDAIEPHAREKIAVIRRFDREVARFDWARGVLTFSQSYRHDAQRGEEVEDPFSRDPRPCRATGTGPGGASKHHCVSAAGRTP